MRAAVPTLVYPAPLGLSESHMKRGTFLWLLLAPSLWAATPENCSALLEGVREGHGIPALAAAVVDEDVTVAIGAAGQRNALTPVLVTIDDHWQIASCTKSMTASVAAMLVEEKLLRWNSTVGEVIGSLDGRLDSDWSPVTLEQLFHHLGGAPERPPSALWKAALAQHGTAVDQRWSFVRGLLSRNPAVPPGSRWIYSDSGYAIAGAMMERAAGRSWEELMRNKLFKPLGMSHAGFGPSSSPNQLDQPWGHHHSQAGYRPVPPGPDADNPPAIAPAAAVHCSMSDLARYAAWHLAGEHGKCRLLTEASFHKLHTSAPGEDYAMGWAVTKRKWAGGTALMHSGDNDTFYAELWLGVGENTAFMAAANASNPEAHAACHEAIRKLINAY